MNDSEKVIGIIGAGNFGKAVANLIAKNFKVLIYTRKQDKADRINATHIIDHVQLSPQISATNSLQEICARCTTIFPIVPSRRFRQMMRDLGPYLTPAHFLIHGTKGFALNNIQEEDIEQARISRKDISLMSEVIRQESSVVRIGCISGPNLASEILAGKPAGTLVASLFDEVKEEAKQLLASDQFRVFVSNDIVGTELAGALKNIIAILSGILAGKDLGRNIQALVITKGLAEMIAFGKMMGAESKAFMGTAGIGDLIATAMSPDSRNFKFGFRLGQGESVAEINANNDELVEGLRTLIIVYHLSRNLKVHLPIIRVLYRIIYGNFTVEEGIKYLMA
ncbi:MAG TPA: NAD(P)H-dependent glycerol-3-phosphate dehydrogenase, partial [Saprospiraceae bacterium]|nr:NAD(P)H-dependent glycerol-3-phosphate dehydrogenase [Saprospiraceae bacterium]